MSVTTSEIGTLGLHALEDYAPLIGAASVDRILRKAERVRTLHAVHISSTFYGGGVTEILTPLTLMMNAIGIETGWRLVQGTPEFFSCTKKLHNALQGQIIDLSAEEKNMYEQVTFENALRLHIDDCDAVIVHDPQPLPLVSHLREADTPWLWQCHVDLSSPYAGAWRYLLRFVEQYDVAIFSLPEYAQELPIEQRFITPAINPFSAKNRELSEEEIERCLAQYRIPTDRPLVVQISRFDPWKDPAGVIDAFRIVREQVDCTLVLVGSAAMDDPEAGAILETIESSVDDRIMLITVEDAILVNALQRRAAVVLQKSIREGFGLTVTEAMWKGAAVVGGNVGGIRLQIRDGENGFLVDSVEEAAKRIVQLLTDVQLRKRLGSRAKQTVCEKFLMSRLLEDWVELLGGVQAGRR
jgi:trehalose synthase